MLLFEDKFDAQTLVPPWSYRGHACRCTPRNGATTWTDPAACPQGVSTIGTYDLDSWTQDYYSSQMARRFRLEPECVSCSTSALENACEITYQYPNYRLGLIDCYAMRFRIKSPWTPQANFCLIAQPAYPVVLFNNLGLSALGTKIGAYHSVGNAASGYNNPEGMTIRQELVDIQVDFWHEMIWQVRWATDFTGFLKKWHRMAGASTWNLVFDSATLFPQHPNGIPTQQWLAGVVDKNGKKPNGTDQTAIDKIGPYRKRIDNQNVLTVEWGRFARFTKAPSGQTDAQVIDEAKAYLAAPAAPPPPVGGAGVPATGILDSFPGADGALGANWAGILGATRIGNAFGGTNTPGYNVAYWNAASFGPNSEAYVTLPVGIEAGMSISLQIQHPISALNFYELRVYSTGLTQLAKVTGGSFAVVASGTFAVSAGDSYLIRSINGTLKAYRKIGAGAWTEILSYVDPSPWTHAGRLRPLVYGTVTRLDDFGGGTVVIDTAKPTTPGSPAVGGPSGTTLTVSWLASSDDIAVVKYRIFRSPGLGDDPLIELVAETTDLFYFDESLTPGGTYAYQVSAVDAAGNESDRTIAVSGTTTNEPIRRLIGRSTEGALQVARAANFKNAWIYSMPEAGVAKKVEYLVRGLLPFPHVSILDDFNRAGPGLGANWVSGTMQIAAATELAGTVAGSNGAYWNAAFFGPDMVVALTIKTLPGASEVIRIQLRNPISAINTYEVSFAQLTPHFVSIRRLDAGVPSANLASTNTVTFAAGDGFAASVRGSTIRVYRKPVGGSWTQILSVVDATYNTTGKPQIIMTGTTGRLDDFYAGTHPVAKLRPFVYDVDTGLPDGLLAVGAETIVEPDALQQWVSMPLSSTPTLPIGPVAFGVWVGGQTLALEHFYEALATNPLHARAETYSTGSSPADPFGAATLVDQEASVRLVYESLSLGALGDMPPSTPWPGGGVLGDQPPSAPYGGSTLGEVPPSISYPPGS